MNENTVNITISKDIVNPIVEAKIKDAITEAMGGKDLIIDKVISQILKTKVTKEGKVSSYERENTENWLDIALTSQIQELVKSELQLLIKDSASLIKETLIKQLKTKKGSDMIATTMLAALDQTFKNSWTSKINVQINSPQSKD